MPRKSGIWQREEDGCYYTTIKRVQHKLGETPEEAEAEFHRLMAELLAKKEDLPKKQAPAQREKLAAIANAFLEKTQRECDPETYRTYRRFLKGFCHHAGKVRFCDLTPAVFNRWVATKTTWGDGAKRGAVGTVKACLNWWISEHNIPSQPLQHLKAPPARAREQLVSDDEMKRCYESIRTADAFKAFFFALWKSGARPSEVRRVEAEHFFPDLGVWVLPGKATRKTGKPRVIYLTTELVELCKVLIRENGGTGPIFRTRDNTQWSRSGIGHRFRGLARKLDIPGLSSYLVRHHFTTAALERGVPIAQVSALLGHVDTKQVMRHYNHLSQKVQHLREQAEKATKPKE